MELIETDIRKTTQDPEEQSLFLINAWPTLDATDSSQDDFDKLSGIHCMVVLVRMINSMLPAEDREQRSTSRRNDVNPFMTRTWRNAPQNLKSDPFEDADRISVFRCDGSPYPPPVSDEYARLDWKVGAPGHTYFLLYCRSDWTTDIADNEVSSPDPGSQLLRENTLQVFGARLQPTPQAVPRTGAVPTRLSAVPRTGAVPVRLLALRGLNSSNNNSSGGLRLLIRIETQARMAPSSNDSKSHRTITEESTKTTTTTMTTMTTMTMALVDARSSSNALALRGSSNTQEPSYEYGRDYDDYYDSGPRGQPQQQQHRGPTWPQQQPPRGGQGYYGYNN
ncbi:uncharacterized protein CCOS01_10647 [Colletotrichum costaricense]|uniref:Uncharacterized protein n=1 Tax=Colletotrichum costaricense TaxID=1209916 RepID=A0AAI9YS95_9PEZI|nr:uncharacterized protein CCOS01_10647 [Colletotrichum costaricense]KAK1520528.1 hypothetical protein CCOS01_10647 [Colletotrichum costaricense]